jgi:D-alanyl-D-alanine carboxypeptidase
MNASFSRGCLGLLLWALVFPLACAEPPDTAGVPDIAGAPDVAGPSAPTGATGVVTSCNNLQLDPARAQRALEAAVASQQLTGAQASIVLCGTEWIGAAGLADVRTGRRLSPATPYRGGSTTKTFTSVILLQLAQEGALGLEDKVARWFPLIPHAQEVTVRMLLGNRSGYYNYTDDPELRAALISQPNRTWLPEELVAVSVRHPLLFAPGTGFAYSNTNFVIAALIAQAVTGKSYVSLLRTRILTPLGLTRTTLPPVEATPGDLAHGTTWGIRADNTFDETYRSTPVRDATFFANYSHGWSAGALISTVHDESVFMRALVRGQLLSLSALLAMAPDDSAPDFLGGKYGLGLMRFPTELGVYAYGHGGQTFGYQTWMLDVPEADLTFVVNANDDHNGVASLNALLDAVGGSLVVP